ncbi:MAG: uracil-DNA glycosylase family protein [bacterium]
MEIYQEIASNGVYISNLAKCTQTDARPLKDHVFKEYLDLIYEEIDRIKPQHIVSFGNQVSSILLNKKITVSTYVQSDHELLHIKKHTYTVYPTFYPVGQGMRNLPKAIARIQDIINSVV